MSLLLKERGMMYPYMRVKCMIEYSRNSRSHNLHFFSFLFLALVILEITNDDTNEGYCVVDLL
jgi:hypothetical protein